MVTPTALGTVEHDRLKVRIGMIIRRRRLGAGLTLSTLGERVGLSPQQLGKYETGIDLLSSIRLMQLCAALRLPLAEVEREMASSAPPMATPPPRILLRVLALASEMGEGELRILHATAMAIRRAGRRPSSSSGS